MYLLFLDIVKASSTLIKEWMKATNILTSYKENKIYMCSCIAKMRLDWFKIIESEFRWVSDIYAGYCEVLKWLYHSTTRLKDTT